jgi:predicted MFS family arabinose efflux permease
MEEKRDPFDGDYVGNIFGWRLSMYGAVVILAFLALAAYRHHTMDVPVGFDDPLESQKDRFAPAGAADRAKEQLKKDSLLIE